MKFIVFGLGNYGSSLARKLVSLGHEVIGVDIRMELVDKYKNSITHTIALDAGIPEAVKSLPLKEVDVVLNAIGENEGSSIMLAALLKQIGVKRLICRVLSPLQKTVLEAMNIEEFVHPEEEAAERMAYKLDLKGVVDSFKVSDRFQMIEVEVPQRYVGQKIGEVDFINKYDIQPITILRSVDSKNIFGSSYKVKQVLGLLTRETVLIKDDVLLLFGEVTKLEDFVEG